MKIEYVRPEYENANLLEDIMNVSVQEDGDSIKATIGIEDLLGPSADNV